jgi:hypothetical protein
MTREQVKEILDRVLTWPADEQEKVAQVICAIEQLHAEDDITDEEWEIIEGREAEDLATDEEVEEMFSRYR